MAEASIVHVTDFIELREIKELLSKKV